jgi:hypothetical protein
MLKALSPRLLQMANCAAENCRSTIFRKANQSRK